MVTVTQQRGEASASQRIIDTDGDRPFTATYVAVLATEVVVLLGLWWFSQYFSG